MPAPIAAAAAIGAGAGMLGNAFNAWSTDRQNRKNRKFTEHMYRWQRQDALADYHMQNEYNSPAAQMKRFKEAGLNPHLIYGQMNEGATVRSTGMDSPHQEAPQFDTRFIGDSIMSYFDASMKQAQTDNLRKALETADEQIKLTRAQTASTLANAASTEFGLKKQQFDLAAQQMLQPLILEGERLKNRKMEADTTYTLNQDERAAIANAQTIKESVERIAQMRIQNAKTEAEKKSIEQVTRNAKIQEEISTLDLIMKRRGQNPTDPAYQRFIGNLFQGVLDHHNMKEQQKRDAMDDADNKRYMPKWLRDKK